MKPKSGMIKYALSLITDQFFAVVVSILLMNIINFFFPDRLEFIQYLLSFLFFTIFLYVDSWGKASSDKVKQKLGAATHFKLKGFVFGAIAAIPSVIIAALAFLSEVGVIAGYEFLHINVFVLINRFWQIPLGLILSGAVNSAPWVNILLPLWVPIVSGVGYLFGSLDITIRNLLLYSRSDKS